MNHEAQLRLQAWVDGELPPAVAEEVARWVAQDSQAGALATELRGVKLALDGNELPRNLPESREFYWSKIQRQIERMEAAEVPSARPLGWRWWLRYLAPVAVLAGLTLVLAPSALRFGSSPSLGSRTLIESPLDDISSFTFRSESERMTIVWVSTQ